MNTVIELEQAVEKLSKDDLNRFGYWFSDYFNSRWDKQIEVDYKKGRLESIIREAKDDIDNGNYTEL